MLLLLHPLYNKGVEGMLQIFPLTKENMACYNTIDKRYLAGESVTVKIARSGFSLAYSPVGEALWRQDEPIHFLPPTEMVESKDLVCYLAFLNGKCVGQAVCVENWNNQALLWEIAVDLQVRRKKIGEELLKACEDWAKKKKLEGIMAEVPDSNPIACQFFEAYAFTLGGVDQKLYQSLPEQQKKAPQLRDTALFFYYNF